MAYAGAVSDGTSELMETVAAASAETDMRGYRPEQRTYSKTVYFIGVLGRSII